MNMRRLRILIADDHALMAEGLARILAAEFEVVGIVSDGRKLLAEAATLLPDIACLDIGMPSLNGIQAAVELHRLHPRMKLVFVTQQIELPYVLAAFRAGASGYIAKQSAGSELLTAMRIVARGDTYITPECSPNGTQDPRSLMANASAVFKDVLTQRQREVLQLVAEGRTVKEISVVLKISPKTVEFHKGCLMDELGLRTTAELTRYALSHYVVVQPDAPELRPTERGSGELH
jgi:DNA-binding NarL/FixJ family response regulator